MFFRMATRRHSRLLPGCVRVIPEACPTVLVSPRRGPEMPQRPYTRTLAASAAALALLMAACAPQPAQQATAAAPEAEEAVPELLQPSVAAAAPEADVAAPGHGVEPDAEQTAETPAVTTTGPFAYSWD